MAPKSRTRKTERFSRRKFKTPMKKVSKRGAYKKQVKRQMINRRAPLVETKQRVAADVALTVYGSPAEPVELAVAALFNPKQPLNWRPLHNDSGFHNIPMTPWLRQVQGLEEDNMIGRDILSKYLKIKFEFRFPYNELTSVDYTANTKLKVNKMIDTHRKFYVVHGWVTNPLQAPIDAQAGAAMTKNRTEITQTMLNMHVGDAIRSYFDNGVDRLSFRERQTSDIKILGYKRIRPNLDSSVVSQATPSHNMGVSATTVSAAHGAIPNVHVTCNWGTINRKIALTKGVGVTDSTEPPADTKQLENFYPNDNWLPFCFIYNKDYIMGQSEDRNHADAQTLPINNMIMYTGVTDKAGEVPNDGICQHLFYRYNMAHWYTDS